MTNASAQLKLDFDMGNRGPLMSEDHYGIFYEEINHAGDGGLYAELVRNRSFEEDSSNPICWWTTGGAQMQLITTDLLNIQQEHALRVNITAANGGVRNEGYWGINVVNGRIYTLTFWMKAESAYNGTIVAELQNEGGSNLGRSTISVNATGEWQKYTTTIRASGNEAHGWLALKGSVPGVIMLDVVSLFPPTYKNRPNGCRKDLAKMLEDLKPRFMRFPGGCYIEGFYGEGKTNRYEWKKTIGPIEERPGHLNRNWGYRVTDGLGYHEMLQLSEDLGANPMFVVNIGIGHEWVINENQLDPFIQEALDAIEYANGSTDTYYGKLRAENGHPESFNLKYLEIGNEQEFMLNRDDYMRRYMQFYRAIKTRWPDLHLIADSYYFNNVTEPVELKDEHYYDTPEFFIGRYNWYDGHPRSATKVYVGEYAVTQNFGGVGNLNAAIGEAVFMQGCENNSDAVSMLSYAPIFTHEDNFVWRPDMIRFNSSISYGTPSYHVQKMFANNVGKQNIKWTETDNVPSVDLNHGTIGIGTWLTNATFSDLSVTASDTTFKVVDTDLSDWITKNGSWSVEESGIFKQANSTASDVTCVFNKRFTNTNVTFSLKATKNRGSEGFLIIFDYKDEKNYSWLNLGGWGNTRHAVEQCKEGVKTVVSDKTGTLETGHEYTIRVQKTDQHVRCYLDNELIIETDQLSYPDHLIYTCANIDDEEGTLYIKMVNPIGQNYPTTLSFKNGRALSAEAEVLTSPNGTDENVTSNPSYIIPRTRNVSVNNDGTISFNAAAYSVNVLRVKVDNVVVPEEETLPDATLSFSFEDGTPTDDSGQYTGELKGKASIDLLADGNHVLATGKQNESSYMTIPLEAMKQTFQNLDEYSISINVLPRIDNNTSSFCWAFDMSNGTDKYLGLINSGGNGNWYFQIKDGDTKTVDSWSGLRIGEWHNITYTQKDGVGRIYVNGDLRNTQDVNMLPKQFINNITSATIGKSPFSADLIMENTLFDDFKIYDKALTEGQVKRLALQATSMVYEDRYEGINNVSGLEALVKEVKNYVDKTDDETLQKAYNTANRSLSGTNILKERNFKNLTEAVNNYQQAQLAKARAGEAADLTFMITNSAFTRVNVGWKGADLPAVQTAGITSTFAGYTDETAEQFSRGFDIFQELTDLPEGYYTLTCSAFYRTGAIEAAHTAWENNAPETQYAQIYMNDEWITVTNLFDSKVFTYSPYNYPDNLAAASDAFNTKKEYGDNKLTIHVDEGGSIRLGIRKLQTVTADWVAYDNFTLRYEGNATGINSVKGQNTSRITRTEVFTTDGRAATGLERGVVILRHHHADGTVSTEKQLR